MNIVFCRFIFILYLKLWDTCILYLFKPALSLQEIVITASPDTSIRVWGVANAQCGQMIRAHDAPVTGISLHATGDYLLSCSTDMVWRFVVFLMRVI